MDRTKLNAIIMLFVLLNSQIAFAENGLDSCYTSSSSINNQERKMSQEAYEAIRNLEADGFTAENLGPATEQSDLEDEITPEILVETTTDNSAIPMEVPQEIFYFTDIPYLMNTTYQGPYAMGVILTDTLRAGRCTDMEYFRENGITCALEEGLKYRNSGEGFANDFKMIGERVGTILGQIGDTNKQEDFINGKLNVDGFNDEFQEQLKQDIIMGTGVKESLNPIIKTRNIEEGYIQNHIKLEEFEAGMEGNIMNNPQAVVEIYSMFDKYFNAWFTMDLVFSNFGPTLLGKAKDLVTKPLRQKNWGKTLYENLGLDQLSREARLLKKAEKITDSKAIKEFSEEIKKITAKTKERNMYLQSKYPKAGAILNEIADKKMFSSSGKSRNYLSTVADKIRQLNADEQGALYEMIANIEKSGEYAMARETIAETILKNTKEEVTKLKTAGAITDTQGKLMIEETNLKALSLRMQSMQSWDDMMDFDIPEFAMNFPRGEFSKYGYKQNGNNYTFVHSWTFKSGKGILSPYYKAVDDAITSGKTGQDFIETVNKNYKANLERIGYEVTGETGSDGITRYGLSMYEPESYSTIGSFTNTTLPGMTSGRPSLAILGANGDMEFLTIERAKQLAETSPTGTTKVFASGFKDTPDFSLTPQQLENRYLENFVAGRTSKIQDSFKKLKEILVEEGATMRNRTTLNYMDEVFSKNMKDLTDMYVNPKTALLKWTGGSIAYWQARKGFSDFGLGIASAIMLPESWGTFRTNYKEDLIYNDAYIDFFANSGSDDSDMLARVINSPVFSGYKFILDSASNYLEDKTGSQAPFVENIRVNKGRRTSVQDLVVFSYITEQTCADCSIGLKLDTPDKTGSYADILFQSSKLLKTKIMENSQKIDEKGIAGGSVLIAFAHHLDLESDLGGEKIDITKAIEQEETCKDKATFLGINIGSSEIGAVIGIAENLAYAVNFGFGIMTSIATQLTIAQDLQGCIDSEEGYFIYMFAPFKIDESQGEQAVDVKEKKAEIAYDVVQNIDDIVGEVSGTTAIDAMKTKVKEITKAMAYKAMVNTTIQASLDAKGKTEGTYTSNRLTMLWFSGNAKANLNKYDKESEIKLWDDKHSVVIDKKRDLLNIDGNIVNAGEDIARMAQLDPESQSYILPSRLGAMKLDNTETTIFKINKYSELEVQSEAIYDCLKKIVEDQTGLSIDGKNITHVFGKVRSIATETHNIGFDSVKDEISANGTPRIIATKNPYVTIKANAGTFLNGQEGESLVGLLDSIMFDNGTIVYNKDTQELIVHLKYHNSAILSQEDVENMIITPATVQGEDCPEPAINLAAIANSDSEKSKMKVENFNKSIEKMGPFQVLETESRIYMFYSKLEDDGLCHDYFKIIDKATGETIYEGEIDGPLKATPTGIEFNTKDGQTHTIDADAHNGVPTISYNDGTPETLLKAKGPNGSFWYNPETGQWYPENGYMIPLDSAFKQGFLTTKENGQITTSATGNILNVNLGSDASNPLNLPSLPIQDLGIFFLLLIISLGAIYSHFSFTENFKVEKKKIKK